jgi:hypothetical protein
MPYDRGLLTPVLRTPLILAIEEDKDEVVKLLIEKGADVNAPLELYHPLRKMELSSTTKISLSPLVLAVKNKNKQNTEIAKQLIKHIVSKDLTTEKDPSVQSNPELSDFWDSFKNQLKLEFINSTNELGCLSSAEGPKEIVLNYDVQGKIYQNLSVKDLRNVYQAFNPTSTQGATAMNEFFSRPTKGSSDDSDPEESEDLIRRRFNDLSF